MGILARRLSRPDSVLETIEANRRAVDAIVARAEGAQLRALLTEVEAELGDRLRTRLRPELEERWTGQQLHVVRAQVQHALRYLHTRMLGGLAEGTDDLSRRALRDTVRVLRAGEAEFGHRGASIVTPLALEQAMRFEHSVRGVQSSLLRQYPTSVDRYRARMIGEFERQMQLGIVSQNTVGQMIDRLVGHGGPRGRVSLAARVLPDGRVQRMVETEAPWGLLRERRYWAERIVRTELLNSYSAGLQEGMEVEQAEDFPDLKRLIIAHFDRVTAPDSVYVHGQIRGMRELFIDGAGREYLRPPGRPNDRETLVPWREGWGKPKGPLAPRPAKERGAAVAAAGSSGAAPSTTTSVAAPARKVRAASAKTAPTTAAQPPVPTPGTAAPPAVHAARSAHAPSAYVGRYAPFGIAAEALGWGHAMQERGLDFPLDHARAVAANLAAGPFKTLRAYLDGLAKRNPGASTLREVLHGTTRASVLTRVHAAAALVGHIDAVSPRRTSPIAIRLAGAPTSAARRKRDQADRFSSLLDQAVPFAPTTVRVPAGNTRAYYNSGTANVSSGRPESSLWHELGHAVEDHNPAALRRAIAFRDHRTAGEVPQRLDVLMPGRGFGPKEKAKPDKFDSPYTGKIYAAAGVDYATEVTSMGLTQLGKNWKDAWKVDKEHFLFTLGQLGIR